MDQEFLPETSNFVGAPQQQAQQLPPEQQAVAEQPGSVSEFIEGELPPEQAAASAPSPEEFIPEHGAPPPAAADGAAQPPPGGPVINPVATPPPDGSPTVGGMPNQVIPGWQGMRPEHLGESPPNMPGPTEWNVTADQTVQGQMTQALTKGNPLYDAIRSKVVSAFLSRGGKNSLRAQQAAEMIVVETAFKIGMADAQTYARSAEFNAAMKNQFSAAEQRFMHEALLSDQNFNQAKAIQQMQIEAERERASAAVANAMALGNAQADLMEREQDNWLERAAISHRYNVEIIGLQDVGERGRMRLSAQLEGGLDDRRTDNLIRRDNNLLTNQMTLNTQAFGHEERMSDLTYRQNWSLNEQRQAHGLETIDRTTDNAIRERGVAFQHQTALNYQSEVMNNLRGSNSLVTQILSTPGLSPAQQQAAIRTIGQMTRTTDELIGSFYTAIGVNVPTVGGGSGGSGTTPSTPSSLLGTYTDYRSYGNPYVANTAPVPGQGGATHQGSTPPPRI